MDKMSDLFIELLDAVQEISYSYFDKDMQPEIEVIEKVEAYIKLLRAQANGDTNG